MPMDRAVGTGFLVKFYNGSAPLIIIPVHILTSSSSSSSNPQNSTTTNTSAQTPLLPDNVVSNPVFEGIAGTMAFSLVLNIVFIVKRRK